MKLSCFRKNVDAFDVVSDIHRYPHALSKVDKGVDGMISHSVVKLPSKPPVDQLLSADWTCIDSMLLSGYSLSPIHDYLTPGLEESVNVVNTAIDLAADESALIAQKRKKAVEPTSQPTSQPIPQPTPQPTPNV